MYIRVLDINTRQQAPKKEEGREEKQMKTKPK